VLAENVIGPFAEDVAVFVHTLFDGLDHLIHDPEFVFDLPGPEIRPLWRGEWAIGGPTRSVAQG
jgi:hypothetical protein